MTIDLSISGSHIKSRVRPIRLVGNTVKMYLLRLTFSEEWNGYPARYAIFTNADGSQSVKVENDDTLYIPGYTLTTGGKLCVAFKGVDEEGERTIGTFPDDDLFYVVDSSLDGDPEDYPEISPTFGEQVMAVAEKALNIASEMESDVLPATGAEKDQVPTADGNGGWSWQDQQGGAGSGGGTSGADGYSPSAKVTQTDTGATITITDKDGTTTATVTNGADGATGPQGPAGADGVTPDLQIGTVETLAAGSNATASITGTAENPLLNLGIPKGADGDVGNVPDLYVWAKYDGDVAAGVTLEDPVELTVSYKRATGSLTSKDYDTVYYADDYISLRENNEQVSSVKVSGATTASVLLGKYIQQDGWDNIYYIPTDAQFTSSSTTVSGVTTTSIRVDQAQKATVAEKLGYVSASSSSAYPADGGQDGYWYVLLGKLGDGLPPYTLPAATATELGGIMADPAEDTDTQPVRIGADGRLYTTPGSSEGAGGGSSVGGQVWMGTCDTGASALQKVVTTYTGDFVLTTGAVVYIKMAYPDTSSIPFLNVDETGNVSLKQYGTYSPNTYMWNENAVICVMYDGANFVLLNGTTASTRSYGMTKLSSSTSSDSTVLAATASAVKAAYDLADGKQDALTFDTSPTQDSTNPVTSGGVYAALQNIVDEVLAQIEDGDEVTYG